jgi:selenocysteine lyase/cysteine desulfurase
MNTKEFVKQHRRKIKSLERETRIYNSLLDYMDNRSRSTKPERSISKINHYLRKSQHVSLR